MQLARVITLGALNRNESRGAHYKPDFPERDDENFLKTTIAEYSDEAPVFSYEAVDVSLVEPRKRDYSKGKTKAAAQVPQPGSELKPEGREEQWVDQGKIKQGKSFEDIVDEEKK